MEALGKDAEDAAARVTELLSTRIDTAVAERENLLMAIGDVIEIVTERSRLAHNAHRLISEIRRREMDGWRRTTLSGTR
jgi:hypothetical protein